MDWIRICVPQHRKSSFLTQTSRIDTNANRSCLQYFFTLTILSLIFDLPIIYEATQAYSILPHIGSLYILILVQFQRQCLSSVNDLAHSSPLLQAVDDLYSTWV